MNEKSGRCAALSAPNTICPDNSACIMYVNVEHSKRTRRASDLLAADYSQSLNLGRSERAPTDRLEFRIK